MGWGMFSSEGVGPLVRIIGTINTYVYVNIVEHVTSSLEPSPNQPVILYRSTHSAILQSVLKIILNNKMFKQ